MRLALPVKLSWAVLSKAFENVLETFTGNLHFSQQEQYNYQIKFVLKFTLNLISSYKSIFYF